MAEDNAIDLDDDGTHIKNDHRGLEEWCRDDFEGATAFLAETIRRYRDK